MDKPLKGKYFNTDEEFGRHSNQTLRIEDAGGGDEGEGGNGWSIVRGGMVNAKGKLVQANVVAHCATRKEAEGLIVKLCEL